MHIFLATSFRLFFFFIKLFLLSILFGFNYCKWNLTKQCQIFKLKMINSKKNFEKYDRKKSYYNNNNEYLRQIIMNMWINKKVIIIIKIFL